MKRFFFVLVMCIGILAANAQVVEKTFAELKNEGNAANAAKDFPKALELYEQALVKLGDKPIVDTTMIYNMGIFALNSKNYEKALKYFDQTISMNKMKLDALLKKADVYRITKNDVENLKTLEVAYAISPKDTKVLSKLTGYYIKEGSNYYSKGGDIIAKANAEVAAGKLKVTDAAYKTALQKASIEFKKSLPLIEKALSYDANNAKAKELKAACEQALKG